MGPGDESFKIRLSLHQPTLGILLADRWERGETATGFSWMRLRLRWKLSPFVLSLFSQLHRRLLPGLARPVAFARSRVSEACRSWLPSKKMPFFLFWWGAWRPTAARLVSERVFFFSPLPVVHFCISLQSLLHGLIFHAGSCVALRLRWSSSSVSSSFMSA